MSTLTPEDHLLHICLHGSFQHGLGQPAINACDTYLLSQLPELDWEIFLKRASNRLMMMKKRPFIKNGFILIMQDGLPGSVLYG